MVKTLATSLGGGHNSLKTSHRADLRHIKHEKTLCRKNLGFTLAEVLITLAIIGVVAALTIPTVVHKYQQRQLYTSFMKMYNTLTNAMELIESENESKNWDWDNGTPFQDYIIPQLKVSKVCEQNG